MPEIIAQLPAWILPLTGIVAVLAIWLSIRGSGHSKPTASAECQTESSWELSTHDMDVFGKIETKKSIIDKSRRLALYDLHRHTHPDQRPYCLFCFAEGENFYPVHCDNWKTFKEEDGGKTRQIGIWVVTGDLQDTHGPAVWPEHFLPIADIPNDTERARIGALVREALCFRALSKLGPDDLPDIVWAAELGGVRSYITDYI